VEQTVRKSLVKRRPRVLPLKTTSPNGILPYVQDLRILSTYSLAMFLSFLFLLLKAANQTLADLSIRTPPIEWGYVLPPNDQIEARPEAFSS
jgi:hypothetical protein